VSGSFLLPCVRDAGLRYRGLLVRMCGCRCHRRGGAKRFREYGRASGGNGDTPHKGRAGIFLESLLRPSQGLQCLAQLRRHKLCRRGSARVRESLTRTDKFCWGGARSAAYQYSCEGDDEDMYEGFHCFILPLYTYTNGIEGYRIMPENGSTERTVGTCEAAQATRPRGYWHRRCCHSRCHPPATPFLQLVLPLLLFPLLAVDLLLRLVCRRDNHPAMMGHPARDILKEVQLFFGQRASRHPRTYGLKVVQIFVVEPARVFRLIQADGNGCFFGLVCEPLESPVSHRQILSSVELPVSV